MKMLQITSADPAIESIYGSPAKENGRDSSAHSERHAGRVVLVSYTSPSSKQSIGGIVIPRNTSTNSSPSSDRLKQISEIPNWRPVEKEADGTFKRDTIYQSGAFVQRAGNEADDVFGDGSQSAGQGELFPLFDVF